MRVLVTGGTGFAGSHTVRALMAAGHEVRLLVRSIEKAERIYGAGDGGIPELVLGDIVDAESVDRALKGCNSVVHGAAVVAIEKWRADEVLKTNLSGVRNVVGGACRMGFDSIVYISSVGALFQPRGPEITVNSPVVEGRNAYAKSKAQSELFVRELQDQGAPIHVTYPTAIVGPDDPGQSEAIMGMSLMLRKLFLITSGAFQIIDVRDLAEINAKLVGMPGKSGRYIVAAECLPWRELADQVDALTGLRGRRVALPGPLLRVGGRIFDQVKRVVEFEFPLTREAMEFATLWVPADGSAVTEELGVSYRSTTETLTDTIRSLYLKGALGKEHVGQLAD